MQPEYRRPELRAALAVLMQAVLADLVDHDQTPSIDAMPEYERWRRQGQEAFLALHRGWHMPARVSHYRWLETFPQMAAVRAAIDADPVLSTRVDTLVGVEFHARHRQLGLLLVEHLLEPVVTATRSYQFDEDTFDALYRRLEDGLLTEQVHVVEFIPLLAFVAASPFDRVELGNGLVLEPMTDSQISAAIMHGAVPVEFSGGTNSVRLSRFHQWALTTQHTFPVCSAAQGMPAQPVAPPFPTLYQPASRLVKALRIVCGGSAVTTREIQAQHDHDFPLLSDMGAVLSTAEAVDMNRPTLLLTSQDVDAVGEVFTQLHAIAVESDRALQTALRRLVLAGSGSDPADRLVDLILCAEVLFLKRARVTGRQKGTPIAVKAEELLARDAVLDPAPDQIRQFMKHAYDLRNAQMHGDDPATAKLRKLDGSSAQELSVVVDDLERVMRRAVRMVITDTANGPQTDA